MNDSLEPFRVENRVDGRFAVADEVIVEFQASRLLFLNHDFSDVQEESLDLGVVSPELASPINSASRFIGL